MTDYSSVFDNNGYVLIKKAISEDLVFQLKTIIKETQPTVINEEFQVEY